MVPPGARVADVGCDHGYLSIYLLREQIASFTAALDLREGPLNRARANAARFGVEDRMLFARSDGLAALGPGTVDTVVIAGLGGDAIAGILARCPWARDERLTYILQPQSSGNDLRRWLGENGFAIRREALVRDAGFLYAAMEVRFGGGRALTPGEQYVSPQLLLADPALLPEYFDRVIRALRRAAEGIALAKGEEDRRRIDYYGTALREVLEMRERYDDCT